MLRISNAMVLEHPDEFVRTVADVTGSVREGKEVTPHPPPCGPPSPRRRGKLFFAGACAPRNISYLLRGEKVDRDRRSHQPSRAG